MYVFLYIFGEIYGKLFVKHFIWFNYVPKKITFIDILNNASLN